MGLQVVSLAQGLSIFVEFADWLEILNIDSVRFNGFALSKSPYILHFCLI